jgi:hypothetical protein
LFKVYVRVVELTAWLEEQYGVDFSVMGFDQYVFDTVDSIMKCVEQFADKGDDT